MFEETELERFVAVNWNDDAFALTGFGEDVMASFNAGEIPAALLNQPAKLFS